MDKEELYKTILISPTYKYPLLNEIYAIRNKNLETEDYTIAVNGFISIDSLLDNYNLINEKQKFISFLEEKIKEIKEKIKENLDRTDYLECLNKKIAFQEALDFVNKGGKDE